jgi:hypothetical protein
MLGTLHLSRSAGLANGATLGIVIPKGFASFRPSVTVTSIHATTLLLISRQIEAELEGDGTVSQLDA